MSEETIRQQAIKATKTSIRVMGGAAILMMFAILALVSEVNTRSETFAFLEQRTAEIWQAAGNAQEPSVATTRRDQARSLEKVSIQLASLITSGNPSGHHGVAALSERGLCIITAGQDSGVAGDTGSGLPGTEGSKTDWMLRSEVNACVKAARQASRPANSSTLESGTPIDTGTQILMGVVTVPLQSVASMIARASSETLLAIAVILSGSVGSVARSLTLNKNLPRNTIPLLIGLFAGFVAYLVVKGGRFLLLSDTDLPFDTFSNPYSMVLLAVVFGMFAQQMFGRLGELIEAAIKGEMTGREDDQNRPHGKAKPDGAVVPERASRGALPPPG